MSHVRGFRALIMGLPGSGKGHISEKIVKKYGAVHISAGDILRKHINEGTTLGREVKELTSQGILVPDYLMHGIIATAVFKAGTRNFILDGYPRTLSQAKHLEDLVKLDMVIKLVIPHSSIIDMLKDRLVHVPSGRVYNESAKAPLRPGLDDITGEKLIRRPDDSPAVVGARLAAFDYHMQPVIRFYRKRDILFTFTGRQHRNLWPVVEKFLNKRLGKVPVKAFRPQRNLDLLKCPK